MVALPGWLNPFDVFIVLGLLAGLALGFVRGLVRMALSLLVLYVAAILAMTFYDTVGNWFSYMVGIPPTVGQGLAFILVLVLTAAVINFVLRRTYKDTELPGVRQIDQLGGMIIGFFLAVIWIGFAILVVSFVLTTPVTGDDSFRLLVLSYFHNSNLIPIFYTFLPIALATLRPWMPKGLPPEIFTIRF